jgi:hypothetical protein
LGELRHPAETDEQERTGSAVITQSAFSPAAVTTAVPLVIAIR